MNSLCTKYIHKYFLTLVNSIFAFLIPNIVFQSNEEKLEARYLFLKKHQIVLIFEFWFFEPIFSFQIVILWLS